jgi:hypothetical protein
MSLQVSYKMLCYKIDKKSHSMIDKMSMSFIKCFPLIFFFLIFQTLKQESLLREGVKQLGDSHDSRLPSEQEKLVTLLGKKGLFEFVCGE